MGWKSVGGATAGLGASVKWMMVIKKKKKRKKSFIKIPG